MVRNKLTPQEIENRKIITMNLNKLINEKGISQAELSRRTDISPTTLNGYFKGTSTPNPGNIQKLADFFNVRKSSIDPRFAQAPSNLVAVKEFVKIPILGTITCGDPISAEENIEGFREEPADGLPSGNLFYLRTKGTSMVPTVPENSYVLIKEQPEVEENEIAAVLINGDTEATLKRVKRQGNMVILVADNPEYPPHIITEENPARIIGKAIKVSFDL